MATDIPDLVGRFAAKKAEADAAYAELRQLEGELVMALKGKYRRRWGEWERGEQSFKADGVTIKVTRKWDEDKVRAEIGEERPDLVWDEEVPAKVVTKVDGRKLASLMRDESYAKRLGHCIKPQVPRITLG